MPTKPDAVVVVYEYGGSASEHGFGIAGVKYENPRVQVVCRGAAFDYDGPRAVAQTIHDDLAKVQATTLGSTKYLMMTPMQTPFLMRRDDSDRVHIAFNVIVSKEPA